MSYAVQGYDALMAALAVQHAEYHKVQYRPVASAAAAPSAPSAYVLGEYRMQDVGGLAGHPATFRWAAVCHVPRAYGGTVLDTEGH